MKERPQEPYRIERVFLGEITAGEMISYIYRSYGGLSASAGGKRRNGSGRQVWGAGE